MEQSLWQVLATATVVYTTHNMTVTDAYCEHFSLFECGTGGTANTLGARGLGSRCKGHWSAALRLACCSVITGQTTQQLQL
jgi:hypothetical protein